MKVFPSICNLIGLLIVILYSVITFSACQKQLARLRCTRVYSFATPRHPFVVSFRHCDRKAGPALGLLISDKTDSCQSHRGFEIALFCSLR